jgi:hypothetical protein
LALMYESMVLCFGSDELSVFMREASNELLGKFTEV